MARKRQWALLAIVSALAFLAMPALAATKDDHVLPKSLRLSLSTEGSNGYSVSIETIGHKQVSVVVSKGHLIAIYRVSGKVSRHGIEADLGDLGRISLRFDGAPRPITHRDSCKGKDSIRETGIFTGTIEFDGEQEFTEVSAERAKGSVRRSYRRVCKYATGMIDSLGDGEPRPKTPGPIKLAFTFLSASSRADGRSVLVDALSIDGGSGTGRGGSTPSWLLVAGLDEKSGRVHITRAAFVPDAGLGSVVVSPPDVHPATATVEPSKPFAGSASYLEVPGSAPTWTGTLSVWLPGAGQVPLAGEGFKPTLCNDVGFDQLIKCLEASEPKTSATGAINGRPFLQGSGSHSQAFWDARLSWSR